MGFSKEASVKRKMTHAERKRRRFHMLLSSRIGGFLSGSFLGAGGVLYGLYGKDRDAKELLTRYLEDGQFQELVQNSFFILIGIAAFLGLIGLFRDMEASGYVVPDGYKEAGENDQDGEVNDLVPVGQPVYKITLKDL